MNNTIEKLIQEKTKIQYQHDLCVEQSQLLEKQLRITEGKLNAAEKKLMKTYFSIKNNSPKYYARRILDTIPHMEANAIQYCLNSDYPTIRSFYRRREFWRLADWLDYSESGANKIFKRSLHRLRHVSRSQRLLPVLQNNKEFLKITQIKEDVLGAFLKENYYFEINLCCWVFKTTKIYQ